LEVTVTDNHGATIMHGGPHIPIMYNEEDGVVDINDIANILSNADDAAGDDGSSDTDDDDAYDDDDDADVDDDYTIGENRYNDEDAINTNDDNLENINDDDIMMMWILIPSTFQKQ
jgi:hypothetical protein